MDSEVALDRHVSPFLATAIVAVPLLFTWLLLRSGYANSTRRAGFLYMVVITAITVIGREFG